MIVCSHWFLPPGHLESAPGAPAENSMMHDRDGFRVASVFPVIAALAAPAAAMARQATGQPRYDQPIGPRPGHAQSAGERERRHRRAALFDPWCRLPGAGRGAEGTQGDLYGQNTTAGQINFISITPPDHFDSSLRLGYPSCQTLHIQGHVNGAPAHGIDGRIAFTSTQSGQGWQNSLTWPGDRCPRAAHDPCRARWVHSPATSPE